MKNNMYFSPMHRTLFTICLLAMASLLQAQNIQISGVVLDEAEEPLPGVSIQVKGTQRGTSSGVNGDFAIKAGPRATLVFSFIGYERPGNRAERPEKTPCTTGTDSQPTGARWK